LTGATVHAVRDKRCCDIQMSRQGQIFLARQENSIPAKVSIIGSEKNGQILRKTS
jgi:hypothetical protein